MAQWDIKILYVGKITVPTKVSFPGVEDAEFLDTPYLCFLLQSRDRNVLVDCGISENFIVDGKAWGGYPAEGGQSYVEKALKKAGQYRGEFRCEFKDGNEAYVDINISPVP